jgi:hypothetical protein
VFEEHLAILNFVVEWIVLAQDVAGLCEHVNELSGSIKFREFLD